MNHSWSVLFGSILAMLHLTSSVSYGEDCLEIMVGQTTDYKTPTGEDLEIHCTYHYVNCTNQLSYNVSWYKWEKDVYVPVTSDSHTNTKLMKLSNVKTMLSLCFTNIQKSNAGFYRCQSELTVGHRIEVSVYDNHMETNFTLGNETSMPGEGRWMYVYSAAGTVAFVIIVIFISVISMQRCKGHARRETQTETQQLSLVNQQTGAKPQDLPASPSSDSKKSSEEEKRPKTRTEKEESSIMYAALNHPLPAGAVARPRRLKEESSEYADIRV